MTFAPTPFYTTNADPEEVFQEARHALSLHPELLDASPDQLAAALRIKSPVFQVEAALEALRLDSGEVAA